MKQRSLLYSPRAITLVSRAVVLNEVDHVATGEKMSFLRRTAGGMSLREQARRMGLSAAYVCDLEHGRRKWTVARAKEYVEALVAYRKGNVA